MKPLLLFGIIALIALVLLEIRPHNPISITISKADGLSCDNATECKGGYCNNYKCDSSPLILVGGGSAPSGGPSPGGP